MSTRNLSIPTSLSHQTTHISSHSSNRLCTQYYTAYSFAQHFSLTHQTLPEHQHITANMRSVLALATLAATAHAAASPWNSWGTKKTTSNCMSDSQAEKVAENFQTLIADYSDKFANQTLTEDFIDYSDSVGELINGGCTEGGSFTVSAICCDYPCLQVLCGTLPLRALHDMNDMLTGFIRSLEMQPSVPAPSLRLARARSRLFPLRS